MEARGDPRLAPVAPAAAYAARYRKTLQKLELSNQAKELGLPGQSPNIARYSRRAREEFNEAGEMVRDDVVALMVLLKDITIAKEKGVSELTPLKERIGTRVAVLMPSRAVDDDTSSDSDSAPAAFKRRSRSFDDDGGDGCWGSGGFAEAATSPLAAARAAGREGAAGRGAATQPAATRAAPTPPQRHWQQCSL